MDNVAIGFDKSTEEKRRRIQKLVDKLSVCQCNVRKEKYLEGELK